MAGEAHGAAGKALGRQVVEGGSIGGLAAVDEGLGRFDLEAEERADVAQVGLLLVGQNAVAPVAPREVRNGGGAVRYRLAILASLFRA